MFVYSVKLNRAMICCAAAVVAVAAVIIAAGSAGRGKTVAVAKIYPGQTNEERLSFIESKGWQVAEEVNQMDIIIPEVFDAVYEKYNALQKSQGFDLSAYSGRKVTRYTYYITNYPSADGEKTDLNMLVYDDIIIGGDISSEEIGGFIHGFDMPE